MLSKCRICNSKCDVQCLTFMMSLELKHIKKKASSCVYHTYWQFIFWIICYNKSIIVCNIATLSTSLSPQHCASSGCGWRNNLKYEGYLPIYWISSHGQPKRGATPALGLGKVLKTYHHKNILCYKTFTGALDLDWPLSTTQDRGRWQAHVNAAMNLQVP
jgi:hypothetical protein